MGSGVSPRGGRKPVDEKDLMGTALREWEEETDLCSSTLCVLPDLEVNRDSVTACTERLGPRIRVFYYVASYAPDGVDNIINAGNDGGVVQSWQPRSEDPDDEDPIVKAYWVRVDAALLGHFKLTQNRSRLVMHALMEFVRLGGLRFLRLDPARDAELPSGFGWLT